MTNARTAVETVLSPRFARPVLAKNGRAATFANRTQAHAAAARVTAQGATAWVTARHPFLVVVECGDGGGVDADTHGLAVSLRCGAIKLPAQAHERGRQGAAADREESGENRPAVMPMVRP
jgi:hypothetical protein